MTKTATPTKPVRMNPAPAGLKKQELQEWQYFEYKRMMKAANSPTTRRKYSKLKSQVEAVLRKAYKLPPATK